ncbi:MAG TPA: DUF3159 domain-containing protein [Mycobacteriales bacterium]|nr:DUF3159 domain-containing protein [Mycobacteriales bacterium]
MTEARPDAAGAPEVDRPEAEVETVSGEPPARPALVEAMGGRRGLFDSGLPVIVFVFANSLVTAFTDPQTGLRAALVAAVVAGLVVVGVRIARRETLQQALSGFFALALAVWLANRSGDPRDFHLPHILWQIGYGTVFLLSALLGRPVIGYIYAAVDGLDPSWRADRRLRRVFTVATLGWFALFATRASVLGSLYLMDRSGLLGAARLVMGWPLTITAVALTIAYVKRARAPRPSAPLG